MILRIRRDRLRRAALALIIIGFVILLCDVFSFFYITHDINQHTFHIRLDYGTYGKNQLNTFQGTVTKDLITKQPITTKLVLSDTDLKNIYRRMVDIHFFDYPKEFVTICPKGMTAMGNISYDTIYKFHVQYHDKMKDILWHANTDCLKSGKTFADHDAFTMDERSLQLRGLITYIENMIAARPEYKKLPSPGGGYL